MLSNAKNGLLAVVLWLVSNTRTVTVLVVLGLITILALSVVLMPEQTAGAIMATAGSP